VSNNPTWSSVRWMLTLGGLSGIGYIIYSTRNDSRHPLNKYLLMPLMRISWIDPETSHRLGLLATKYKIAPREHLAATERKRIHDALHLHLFGHDIEHVVGLAAGFDKNAEAIPGLYNMGFSVVEVGTVTPLPQEGNPRPRVFRLPKDQAIINRYGFNSDGADQVQMRLMKVKTWLKRTFSGQNISDDTKASFGSQLKNWFIPSKNSSHIRPLIGINIGKNRDTLVEKAKDDYTKCIEKLAPLADYITINVSSPNTAGLRSLQNKTELEAILNAVHSSLDALPWNSWNKIKPPVLVKVAPGLSIQEKAAISELALLGKMQGIIVSNTTTERNTLKYPEDSYSHESGGLSGKPLFNTSTQDLHDFARLTRKKVPLIGVGGISSARDAYTKIRNGAWLVQIYSALVFEGPGLVTDIKQGLVTCLEKDGFHHIEEARGIDVSLT
jgi:dihydroorotate dehydrogenase